MLLLPEKTVCVSEHFGRTDVAVEVELECLLLSP